MPRQYLNGAQVARGLVNQRRFGSTQRMGAVFLWSKADRSHPLVDEPCILPGAEVVIGMDSAWKREIVDTAASSLELRQQAGSGVCRDLELNWSARLLLNHHRARPDGRSGHKRADLDFHQIATPEFAVDREIEKRPVSHSSFPIEKEADRPDLSYFQRSLGADLPASISGRSSCSCRVVLRDTHYISPMAKAAVGETIVT